MAMTKTCELDFVVLYDEQQWACDSSVAELTQCLVVSYNRLIERKERFDLEERLYNTLHKYSNLLDDIHALCFSSRKGTYEYDTLSNLMYGYTQMPCTDFPNAKTQLRSLHLRSLTASLRSRLQFICKRYGTKIHRIWESKWFVSMIDDVNKLYDRVCSLDDEIGAIFESNKLDEFDGDVGSGTTGTSATISVATASTLDMEIS